MVVVVIVVNRQLLRQLSLGANSLLDCRPPLSVSISPHTRQGTSKALSLHDEIGEIPPKHRKGVPGEAAKQRTLNFKLFFWILGCRALALFDIRRASLSGCS